MEVVKVEQSISQNLAPINSLAYGGLLKAPPPCLSFSYPPSASLLSTHHHHHHHQYRQPPLLPLPISRPHNHHSPPPSRSRGNSCPPSTGKANRDRDHSITPKKSKSKSKLKPRVSKIEETKQHTKSMSGSTLLVTSTNRLGPEPNDLPKDVSKVLSSSFSTGKSICCVIEGQGDLDNFSGSVFSLAPPPSSLPLPRFSVRPKLSCNAEAQASGIDAGATDNLCRLLRLR